MAFLLFPTVAILTKSIQILSAFFVDKYVYVYTCDNADANYKNQFEKNY